MGWNGDALVWGVLIVGAWFATAVAQFPLLLVRQSSRAEIVAWICLTAQVTMFVRAVQVDFYFLAGSCLVTTAVGLLVRLRWRRISK